MSGATEDFEAFWAHFLESHTHPAVRWCHVAGLACGVSGAVSAWQRKSITPMVLGGATFAAFAVFAHPVFTGHWPENFGHPVWGARAVLRLCVRTVTGSVNAEVDALRARAVT